MKKRLKHKTEKPEIEGFASQSDWDGVLTKEETKRFIRNWLKEMKNPNPARVKLIKEAMKMKFKIVKRL